MDTNKYKSRSIDVEHINDATKLGMTLNAYINHLKESVKELSLQIRTAEQDDTRERVKANEGAIGSMAESLKHMRYMQDSQARKTDQLIEAITKITNAYGADVEFVQALKKEITQ